MMLQEFMKLYPLEKKLLKREIPISSTYLCCCEILCILFFASCWEEHNIVDSLNEFQLYNTFDQKSSK